MLPALLSTGAADDGRMRHPFSARRPLGEPDEASRACVVLRWQEGKLKFGTEIVAEEVPVALVYNGVPHAVMLASPCDLEDLALGYSLTEGIVRDLGELAGVETVRSHQGIELRIAVAGERMLALAQRRRDLSALRRPAPVGPGGRIAATALHAAMAQLTDDQLLERSAGSVHAAAWAGRDGVVRIVREDICRSNALDKLIGAAARTHRDKSEGFAVATGRASHEMVRKAASAGVRLLATLSAPSALAVELAEKTGLTLVGFVRRGKHVVYAHPSRVEHQLARRPRSGDTRLGLRLVR